MWGSIRFYCVSYLVELQDIFSTHIFFISLTVSFRLGALPILVLPLLFLYSVVIFLSSISSCCSFLSVLNAYLLSSSTAGVFLPLLFFPLYV